MTQFLETAEGRRIAFERLAGQGPEIVFLPGFESDMQGTKALHLEAWARARGRAFLRFDYSGHGESSGEFLDGSIGDWAADAAAVAFATPGRKLLVGSSMGGWIALLLARRHPERLAALVGIAAAPDFTSEAPPWSPVSAAERAELARDGRITRANPQGERPTILTRRLIEDGAAQAVLRKDDGSVPPLALPMPVRLLHGSADREVPLAVSLAVLDQAVAADLRLTILKGADHRFSSPEALSLIEATLDDLLHRLAGADRAG